MPILNNDYTDFVKYCNNEFTSYESDKITFIRYSAFNGNNVIRRLSFPNVTELGNYCFANMENLEEISIPSVTRLGQGFLSGNSKITSLSFPNVTSLTLGYVFEWVRGLVSLSMPHITRIEESSFRGCESLTTMDFIRNVTYVGTEAFNICTALTSMSLDSLITLESRAFLNCTGLRKVWIPSSCSTINARNSNAQEDVQWSPFYGCDSSCIIYTDASKPGNNWSQYWNYYDNTHKLNVCWNATYSDYVNDTYSSKTEFENLIDGSTGEIIYNEPIMLEYRHFKYSHLYKISLPQVTTIPGFCFDDCYNLKEINVPNVTRIEEGAYTGCEFLTEFDFSNIVYVGNYAFQSASGIRKVWIPSTCVTLGRNLFANNWNIVVYTDAQQKLENWDENWNATDWENTRFATVYYNSTYEQYLQA